MTNFLQAQAADLAHLAEVGRARSLSPRRGLDFSSNDYLGLAASGLLVQAAREALDCGTPLGSGGSRLLRGNHPSHDALETEAAALFGSESALFFGSGFGANAALFSTLPQRPDLVLHDELIHASAHEGFRLGRAQTRAFAHNDADAVEGALKIWRAGGATGRAWIAVESLYSMDGDRAPLDDLADIAERYEAVLVVDEAHAAGVFGETGLGLMEGRDGAPNLIVLRTLGKALGCEGALLFLPAVARDFLVNRARGFIFSTAPSPLMAQVARAALKLNAASQERREALWRRVRRAQEALAPCGLKPTGSQILPLILGDDRRAMRAAASLQDRGFDVRGIRPPTVPAGTARLRLSLTLNVTEADIDHLAEVLPGALA